MDSQDDYVPITYVALKTQRTLLKKSELGVDQVGCPNSLQCRSGCTRLCLKLQPIRGAGTGLLAGFGEAPRECVYLAPRCPLLPERDLQEHVLRPAQQTDGTVLSVLWTLSRIPCLLGVSLGRGVPCGRQQSEGPVHPPLLPSFSFLEKLFEVFLNFYFQNTWKHCGVAVNADYVAVISL